MFGKLIAHRKAQRKANGESRDLYRHLVTTARDPKFYQPPFNVEDTVEGRFELILVHLFIIDYWLSKSDDHVLLRRALQEILITDMDRSLREMGIGDMSVGKQMKKVGAALLGRLQSYKLAIEGASDDQSAETKIAEIMARNIAGLKSVEDSMTLAGYLVKQFAALSTLEPAGWNVGDLVFVTKIDEGSSLDDLKNEGKSV